MRLCYSGSAIESSNRRVRNSKFLEIANRWLADAVKKTIVSDVAFISVKADARTQAICVHDDTSEPESVCRDRGYHESWGRAVEISTGARWDGQYSLSPCCNARRNDGRSDYRVFQARPARAAHRYGFSPPGNPC